MPIPALLGDFNIAASTVAVWVFRKSPGAGGAPVFTGHWIESDEALDAALKAAVQSKRDSILETLDYSLLATIDHGQALLIETDVTHADQIVEKSAAELPARKATAVRDLQNSDFYVIKLTHGDSVIRAVRKTDASWASKKAGGLLSVFFVDEQLGLETDPTFTLSRDIDFFIVGDDIVMTNKGHFEAVLNYKQAHADDFVALQGEPAFMSIFADMAPLVQHIGTNKLHLRRACSIREKRYYTDAAFMSNLRLRHAESGLNLVFDGQGRLVATPETCADIMKALLNHRLHSLFSETFFDVPSATEV